MRKLLGFQMSMFANKTVCPILLVTIVALVVPSIIYLGMEPSVYRFLFLTCVSFITTAISIFVVGLDKSEREVLLSKLSLFINSKLRK